MGDVVFTMVRLLVRSDPKVVSTHQWDPKKPAKPDLVWPLQFHKAGIGPATLWVIDGPILPASVTFLRKARYEDKADDGMATFLWVRIVKIGLCFSFSRLRLTQSHDPSTQFTFSFEHLKGGVTPFPEPNRRFRIGCMNCSYSDPPVDRQQEQRGKLGDLHWVLFTSSSDEPFRITPTSHLRVVSVNPEHPPDLPFPRGLVN
jgi:hypothetical protein